jgi:site-specific recombinase XerD
VALRQRGLAPQTVRGFAQVAKTLCRFGYRNGLVDDDIAGDLEMPRVPQVIIETFSDEQLAALLAPPDKRRWTGFRDRALLLRLLDTLCRVSELVGLNAEDVDLKDRTMRVMGKGRKQRELPLGKATCQALARYAGAVDNLRPGDPFFITFRGRRLSRWYVRELLASYGSKEGIEGVRCWGTGASSCPMEKYGRRESCASQCSAATQATRSQSPVQQACTHMHPAS